MNAIISQKSNFFKSAGITWLLLLLVMLIGGAAFSPADVPSLYGVTVTPTATLTPPPTSTPAPTEPAPTEMPAAPGGGAISVPEFGKSVSPANAQPGDFVTYSVVLVNDEDKLNDVYVRDPLPANLDFIEGSTTKGDLRLNENTNTVVVQIGVVQPFESVTISILAQVNQAAPVNTSLCNTARLTFVFDGAQNEMQSGTACVQVNSGVPVSAPPPQTGVPPQTGAPPALPPGTGTTPAAGFPLQPPPADGDEPVHYMVKFVCGFQDIVETGEPPVKPGNYATSINIQNYTDAALTISYRPALSFTPDGDPPPTFERGSLTIPAFTVLNLDCNALWAHTGLQPGAFIEGMVDIGTPALLPVVAVYTAEVPDLVQDGQPTLTNRGAGISIDVEYITPFIPYVP